VCQGRTAKTCAEPKEAKKRALHPIDSPDRKRPVGAPNLFRNYQYQSLFITITIATSLSTLSGHIGPYQVISSPVRVARRVNINILILARLCRLEMVEMETDKYHLTAPLILSHH
jgi:hypothetical protein